MVVIIALLSAKTPAPPPRGDGLPHLWLPSKDLSFPTPYPRFTSRAFSIIT